MAIGAFSPTAARSAPRAVPVYYKRRVFSRRIKWTGKQIRQQLTFCHQFLIFKLFETSQDL